MASWLADFAVFCVSMNGIPKIEMNIIEYDRLPRTWLIAAGIYLGLRSHACVELSPMFCQCSAKQFNGY